MSDTKSDHNLLFSGLPFRLKEWMRSPYLIWGIAGLAFILRVVLLFIAGNHISRSFLPDSQSYIHPAVELLTTGFYPPDSAWRTPLYPFFIALIYRIGGQNPLWIVAAQVILGTSTVLLSYHYGSKVISRQAALLGSFLLAINVESITNGFYIMTETLFTFLFLAGMIAWARAITQDSKLWLAMAAFLMGLSVLCRPEAVYFPILLLACQLINRGSSFVRRLALGALFLGIYATSLAPWIVRNIYVVDSPTISTIVNYNLLFYEAASLEANLRHVGEAQVRVEYSGRVAQALTERGWADNESNRARVEGILALQIIRTHPFRFLYIHLKSDLNGLLPDITGPTEILGVTIGGKGTLSVLNQKGVVAAIRNYFGGQTWLLWLLLPLVMLLALVYLFSLVGAIALVRQHKWFILAMFVSPVLYFLLLPGAASLPRFRVPVMPYICLLAGAGITSAWSYLQLKRKAVSK